MEEIDERARTVARSQRDWLVESGHPTTPIAPANDGRDAACIAIVVPAHDAARTVSACLDALLPLTSHVAQILLIDDGSRDGTAAMALARGVGVLRVEEASGPAAARNAGAIAVSAPVVVFVDADVVAPPDAVLKLVAPLLEVGSAVSATFGSYDDAPAAPGLVSVYRNLLHHHTHQVASELSGSFWSGFGAIRRDVFLAHGGFDAQRFPRPSIEDIELGARLWRAGARVRLVKNARVTHLKHWSLSSMVMTDVRDRAWPWSRLLLAGEAPDGDLNVSGGERRRAALAVSALVTSCAGVALLAARGAGLAVPSWLPAVLLGGSGAALLALTALNADFHRLLLRVGGIRLAVVGACLHALYYVYASLTFAACALWLRLTRASSWPRP